MHFERACIYMDMAEQCVGNDKMKSKNSWAVRVRHIELELIETCLAHGISA